MEGRPKPGEKAPEFEGNDQYGNRIALSDYAGSKVVLYFYPRDNTPGCTAQAVSLRDGKAELAGKGFAVIGVNPASEKSHLNFTEKNALNFPIISDPDKAIATAYGVWGSKKFMGRVSDGIHRTTFIIDEKGFIEKVFDKVDTKHHFEQIADSYFL